MPQLKSLHDKTKTSGNQINKYNYFLKKKRPTWQKTCLKQPSIIGKTKPTQKGPTPFISSSLSHSSLWPDPWAILVNRLEVSRWGKRNPMRKKKSNAFFLHWRLQARWGSDEMLPWNQVQGVHYHPGLDTDLWNKTVCNSTIRRVACYLRKMRKVLILEQGHSHPSKPSSIADVGDQ